MFTKQGIYSLIEKIIVENPTIIEQKEFSISKIKETLDQTGENEFTTDKLFELFEIKKNGNTSKPNSQIIAEVNDKSSHEHATAALIAMITFYNLTLELFREHNKALRAADPKIPPKAYYYCQEIALPYPGLMKEKMLTGINLQQPTSPFWAAYEELTKRVKNLRSDVHTAPQPE